jgi:MSHA pilin protein MshA
MKRSQGFTLIELVIVIVILGILAVTAAPKFLDLSGDARASTLEAAKGALASAGAQVYSKAILQGVEKSPTATVNNPTVAVVYGYPAATSAAITAVMELDDAEWTITDSTSASTPTPAGVVAITLEGTAYSTDATTRCQVLYAVATATAKPVITVQPEGC